MAVKKKSTTSSKSPRPKAATWLANGDLAIVAWFERDARAVILRGSVVVDDQRAVPRARRIAQLGSGALITIAYDGKTLVSQADDTYTTKTGFQVREMVAVRGVAYAGGGESGLARFDERARAWVDMPAPGKQQIHSLIDGDDPDVLIVACGDTVLAWNGERWRKLGKIRNCATLARTPDKRIIGCGLHVVELGKPEGFCIADGVWGSAWFDGALHFSSIRNVWRASGDRKTAAMVFEGSGPEPDVHSLCSDGERGAYVCGTTVHVIERRQCRVVFGR